MLGGSIEPYGGGVLKRILAGTMIVVITGGYGLFRTLDRDGGKCERRKRVEMNAVKR